MNKLVLSALILSSMPIFASVNIEQLDGTTVTDPASIYKLLTTTVDGLEFPNCLTFGVRRSENVDLRMATGQYISGINFVKTTTVLNVSVDYTMPNGQVVAKALNFDCRLKK